MYQNLPTPAVVVDLDIAQNNIKKMISGLSRHGVAHRPHIKTHRSVQLARLQLSLGARGITCAKLGEAEVMAQHGIDDILIAYPLVGADKWARYGELYERCESLRTLINTTQSAAGLSEEGVRRGRVYEVLIDLDGGIKRGGIEPFEPALAFAKSVSHLRGIRIAGLLYYPGMIYGETTQEGIERVARRERDDLTGTADLLRKHGFEMKILSGGNTVSSKVAHCMEGITESRAGNYIFNDCAQLYKGTVLPGECAMRVVVTVVCLTGENTAIIDAGTKTFSSDNLTPGNPQFGYIIGHEHVKLHAMHEEHGFIRSEGRMPFSVGDKLTIIPNHACVIANLAGKMTGMRGSTFAGEIIVDAQSKSI